MSDFCLIKAVEAEGLGRGGVVTPAFRNVQVASVFDGRDDGSADGSSAVLQELAAADACVKVVKLRRNYGQTAALLAGIDWSRGDIIVTMDGDLQNDPADIPALLAKLNEGYDVVLGQRAKVVRAVGEDDPDRPLLADLLLLIAQAQVAADS